MLSLRITRICAYILHVKKNTCRSERYAEIIICIMEKNEIPQPRTKAGKSCEIGK